MPEVWRKEGLTVSHAESWLALHGRAPATSASPIALEKATLAPSGAATGAGKRPRPVSPRRHALAMHSAHGLFRVVRNRKDLDRTICKAYASLDFRSRGT